MAAEPPRNETEASPPSASIPAQVGHWLEDRTGLAEVVVPILRHPIPRGTGWWYVFGSATMTMLTIQVVTGILLAMVYVPSADHAYNSLEYLNYQHFMGWMLRALHYFGSSGMVVLVLIHMTRVFLFGAYKYPREMTWLIGVGLLAMTLGMAFTGQILRWDADAYWGLAVATAIAGRVPFFGPSLVRLVLGGPTIASDTLSRFFALHVFILPALLFPTLGLHLFLVLKKGISAPPTPGHRVDPATEDAVYEAEVAVGEPFFPEAGFRDVIFSSGMLFLVVLLAACFGPHGPNSAPDPTLIHTEPRPDWYFLWIFALAALTPPNMETVMLLGLPPMIFVGLALLPFLDGKGERSARRRPLAVVSVLVIFMTLGVLTYLGAKAAWSPKMNAWSGTPVPIAMVKKLTPLELMGATVVQNKSCRNCHRLGEQGGERGPDLDGVGTRLTRDELIRQVIQGGGNMPAYGKQLKPAEVTALVAFLHTLRQGTEPDAVEADKLAPPTRRPKP